MSAQGAALVAELDALKSVFDFTQHDLANQLAEAAAVGVFEAMEAQTGPDGAWDELSEAYAEWKSRHFPGEKMSELHLKMKDPEQLKGVVTATPDRIEQTYGTDDEARQEAVWFQEGGGNQPPRPFYAFNGLVERTYAEVLDRRWDAALPP
jgi:hypothetical protein